MSGDRDPHDDGPVADELPDLVGDGPGWDAPLADLADGATGGTAGARPALDEQGPAGVTGPDAGGVRSGDTPPEDLAADVPLPDLGGSGDDDLWAPAPWTPAGDTEGPADGEAQPADLTRRGGRRTRRRRRTSGDEPGPRPAAPGEPGPVAASLRRARELVQPAAEGEQDPARGAGAEVEQPGGAPLGLATGGLAGGLEPGTLFSNPDPAGPDGPGRGRRGGRRGRGRGAKAREGDDAGPSGVDEPAGAPDRPSTAEERLQHALKLAYRHLTKRDRTVSEVRAHLEKREIDEPSIAAALKELLEFRYLDDERYAARFVEDKRRLEGWGHLRIEQGLRRTGVDREVADRAVAADPQRDDESELAVEALEQRLNGRPPEDDRARQKALRLLATKGYPLDTAYAAVRTYERRCAERDDAD